MSGEVKSYLGIFPTRAGDGGNICQGISLKRLKSSGRELCEDSIRQLILQNVRFTLLHGVADHFTAQLERHRQLCTTLKLAQSVFNYFMCLRVNHTLESGCYHPWLFLFLCESLAECWQ